MAWLTEVNADRSWRLAFGMVVGILYAILIVLCVLLPPGFPAVAALPAATVMAAQAREATAPMQATAAAVAARA